MPKIVDHASRRAEIVHGLWAVIYSRGIDAVSFRSVAEAAGMSIGRVQHYFPSRNKLILEGCRQMASGVDLDETEEGNGDPVAELREFLYAFIPGVETVRLGASIWYTYLARAVTDAQIADIILEMNRGTMDVARRRCARVLSDSAAASSPGSSAAEVDRCAVRLVALAKGLAQEVMLDVRGAESARTVLDEEVTALA